MRIIQLVTLFISLSQSSLDWLECKNIDGRIYFLAKPRRMRQLPNPSARILTLRGGISGPNAKLLPESDDIRVHYPVRGMPEPDHMCLRSALHPSRVNKWNGRRIYVSEAVPNGGAGDALGRRFERYAWDSTIRVGTMPRGTGNHTVARIAGDDQVQLWGKWHFQGPCVGIIQGLYVMHMDYGPYTPLILASHGAAVLLEQCEVRCFGGKCIVMQFFAEVTLDWCAVGGSCGSRAPEHHKKLQIWRRDLIPGVLEREAVRRLRLTPARRAATPGGLDLSTLWAPAGSRRASDGVSVESGSWLVAHRVLFEDTGRAGGFALRMVGHARADLDACRFQRNCVHLAADATAVLRLDACLEIISAVPLAGRSDTAPLPAPRPVALHARRALRLPGNGTSVLEAQAPVRGPDAEYVWRVPNATNCHWQVSSRRPDPNRQRKREEQREERRAARELLRATHPEGVRGARKRVHATHRDFTPFTRPRSRAQRRVARSDRLRYERDLAVFHAPETLTDVPLVRRIE